MRAQTTRIKGKTIPARIPVFRLSPTRPETNPTSVGPPEHPRSPARARYANIAVPPFGKPEEAMLNTPGQRTPTERPHSAHPTRDKTGFGDSDAIR